METAIDQEKLRAVKLRMKDKFPTLIDGYLKQGQSHIDMLLHAIEDGNYASMIEAAHTLKSSSGLLGFIDVSELAESIEMQAKVLDEEKKNIETLRPFYNSISTAFDHIAEYLNSHEV